jgi:hypothetical protein
VHSLIAIKKDPVDLAALFGYSIKCPLRPRIKASEGIFVVVLLIFLKEF